VLSQLVDAIRSDNTGIPLVRYAIEGTSKAWTDLLIVSGGQLGAMMTMDMCGDSMLGQLDQFIKYDAF